MHKGTVTADDLARAGHVALSIRLDDLRFWYAAPEATYVVVYVEAVDAFLAEDVRDIVDRQWGVDFLSPGRFGVQEMITVHVAADAAAVPRVIHDFARYWIRYPRASGSPLLVGPANTSPEIYLGPVCLPGTNRIQAQAVVMDGPVTHDLPHLCGTPVALPDFYDGTFGAAVIAVVQVQPHLSQLDRAGKDDGRHACRRCGWTGRERERTGHQRNY